MRTLNTHLEEVHAKEAGAGFHWYDLLTRWAVPWYLTFALALKVTKNTADYLKLKSVTIAPEALHGPIDAPQPEPTPQEEPPAPREEHPAV
jgi:hypothetical protein